jgi:RimJ/RimL family protein N-acetyltransferase
LNFWKSLGFKKEGVQRDGYIYDNEFHDFLLMSIVEEEYRKSQAK